MEGRRMEVAIGAKDEFSKVFDRLNNRTRSAEKSADTATEKLDRFFKRFESAAARVDVLSQASDSFVSFADKAADLKTSFSKTTEVFVQDMEKLSRSWDAVSFGNGEEERGGTPVIRTSYETTVFGAGREQAGYMENREKGNKDLLGIDKNYSKQVRALDRETWNERLRIAGTSAGNMANIMQNLYVMSGSKHRAMFEVMKAFAIAESIIQGSRAAVGAYAFGAKIGGPVLGAAFAATAAAAAAARIKQIMDTTPEGATGTVSAGGKANPEYSGGSTTAYPVPQRLEEGETLPTQSITLNIYNPLNGEIGEDVGEAIIDVINKAGQKNYKIDANIIG